MCSPRFLGIDTSNYTTSMAVVDNHGKLLEDCRLPLQVAEAQQGLRQSEALFQHVKHLPELMEQLSARKILKDIEAIGVTTAPRSQPNSYMPVFLPGKGLARSLAALLGVPLFELSHQDNHLWAALHSAVGPVDRTFLAIHVSGGTTEILHVERLSDRFRLQLLGGSTDLHAGQMIDRVGVALGLQFPAGVALEHLAGQSTGTLRLPSSVKEGCISLSGPCSQALRWIGKETPEDIAAAVLLCIARSLEKSLRYYGAREEARNVLVSGGVMANLRIRQELQSRMPHLKFWFSAPRFSTDNALGSAVAVWVHQRPEEAVSRLFSAET